MDNWGWTRKQGGAKVVVVLLGKVGVGWGSSGGVASRSFCFELVADSSIRPNYD